MGRKKSTTPPKPPVVTIHATSTDCVEMRLPLKYPEQAHWPGFQSNVRPTLDQVESFTDLARSCGFTEADEVSVDIGGLRLTKVQPL